MKIQFVKTFFILGLLISVGNLPAKAQALSESAIEVDIPHSFVVANTTLPPGKYTVKRLDETETHILEIRSVSGHTAVAFQAEDAQANKIPTSPELVFDKLGDTYFLSQIWTSDSSSGYQLQKTKAEERLEGQGMRAEHHSIFAKAFGKTKKAK